MPIRDRDPLPPLILFDGYEARFMSRVNLVDSLIIIQILQKGARSIPTLVSLNDERGRLPEGSLQIKTVDNDDNTYTQIKAKQAIIKFFSQNSIDLSTFMIGESDEWAVNIYTGVVDDANLIFKGFLVLDVATEPYETKPYNVELTATDNLGLLKNISLTDFNGNNPSGEFKIIKYIAWALSKTNMNLPIYVNNNLFEENNPGIPFYESCSVSAKMFEKNLTSTGVESEDCYTVLKKILGNDSRLEQINGSWWIERIYEKRDIVNYVHQFNYDGTYVGVSSPTFYLQSIDQRGDIDFVNDNAQVTTVSPYKSASLKYSYDFPREIIDNIDFSQGDLNISLPSLPVVIDGQTYYQRKYNIADWQLQRIDGGTTEINAYIRRLFIDSNFTYEKERVIVFEAGQTRSGFPNMHQHRLLSNAMPIGKGDKIDFSVDRRLPIRYGGTNKDVFELFAQIKIVGDDGSVWWFQQFINDPTTRLPGQWQSNAFQGVGIVYNLPDIKNNDWQTASVTTTPMPVSGNLYVYLLAPYLDSPYKAPEAHFSNLKISYIPFINGDYSKYSGERHSVTKNGNYSNILEDQIYINNSPRKLFKGALLRQTWQTFLTSQGIIAITIFGPNLRIITSVSTGDVRNLFPVGSTFKITGTSNNDGIYTVASLNYNAGNTVIETVEPLVNDVGGIPTMIFQKPNYILAGLFYDGQTFPSGVPSSEFLHPFAYQLIYSLWQQYRTFKRSIDTDLLGLKPTSPALIPDLHKQFFFTDNNPNVNNKYFILLHYEQDFDTQVWRAFLREVYDTVIGHVFTDPYEFKYITE